MTYNQELQGMIDMIFVAADDLRWGVAKLAKESGLHYQTVERLNTYTTQYPRLRTIFLLAKAVGLEFRITHATKKKVG